MRSLLGLVCILAAGPVLAQGPKAPPVAVESLLPANAVAYFRYDGYEPHKKAYEQTALARAMKDDLGEFLEYFGFFLGETLTSSLKDTNPKALQKVSSSWPKLAGYLWRHGLAASLELRLSGAGAKPLPLFDLPLGAQLTLVLPDGAVGKNRDVLLPLLKLLTPGKTFTIADRTVHEVVADDLRLGWWQEGRHIVLVMGNTAVPLLAVLAVSAGRPNLQSSPLFKSVQDFKDYETDIRGFVDVKKLVELFRTNKSDGNRLAGAVDWLGRTVLLNQLGLTSVNDVKFHLGFAGKYQRNTVLVGVAEPRQRAGLARLVFAPVEFDPARLPPLPPDAASVRVSQVDWKILYDVVWEIAMLSRLPGALANGTLPADPLAGLGLDIRKELLPHLNSTLVLYNSLSEGPFMLGQGIAIKVRDEKKLTEAMDKLVRGLGEKGFVELQKRTYRGVDLSVLVPPLPFPVAPTFAIHKGWIVLGVFPQPVMGYILRTEGRHKTWQPPPLVAEALALARKKANPGSKLAAVTVTDPRPTTAVGLSVLPVFVRSLGLAAISFDTSKVPNAQAITEWQFPGVTIFYDDGHTLRWESHASIEVPGDWMLFGLFPIIAGL